MDITIDPKKKRNESEPTSEKQSRDKPALKEGEYLIDGKVVMVAPDLAELEEFDWDAPENQEWIAAEDERLRKKYSGMRLEDLDEMMKIRDRILAESPQLSRKEAQNQALDEYRRKIG